MGMGAPTLSSLQQSCKLHATPK